MPCGAGKRCLVGSDCQSGLCRADLICDTPTPTSRPTLSPTGVPTLAPTSVPTRTPTAFPSAAPTRSPTQISTLSPTSLPTSPPSFHFAGEGGLLFAPTPAPTTPPTAAGTVETAVRRTTLAAVQNSNAASAYEGVGCAGRWVALSSIYANILCGTHWAGEMDKGSCVSGDSCVNEAVRSVMLPPMTIAKLHRHCLAPSDASNEQYRPLENFGTTPRCFDIADAHLDVSAIEIAGAGVLKVDAHVVGTSADCLASQCYSFVEACRSDATGACEGALAAAQHAVAGSGEGFVNALRVSAPTGREGNTALRDLLTCVGQHQAGCEPSAAMPVEDDDDATAAARDDDDASSSSRRYIVLPPTLKPIMPVTVTAVPAPARMGAESRRRLAAGASTNVFVQVSTSGNQGTIGSATVSSPSAAHFASPSSQSVNSVGAAGTAGIGVVGTALAAVGCLALVGVAAAAANKSRSHGAPLASRDDKVIQKATQKVGFSGGNIQGIDDQVDVL